MNEYPRRFDEIYVVSDIHMGGRKNGDANFQIFNRGERLGNFIRHLANRAVVGSDGLALILNGDVIDSLAEDEVTGYAALDAGSADRMMQHLFTDTSFAPVWTALTDFLHTPNRHVVVVVGNHDIELSLPSVEAAVRRKIANAIHPTSSLTFSTHGAGFTCMVGKSRVFCTHGNEVDIWNMVDYTLLGQLANAISGGRAADPAKWKPNAGTRLVIDIMNDVKRRYPFVDLLKPEVAAVAGVLMALDKDAFKNIDWSDAFPIIKDNIAASLAKRKILGSPGESLQTAPAHEVAHEFTQKILGKNLQEAMSAAQTTLEEDDLLVAAGAAVQEGKKASATMPIQGGSQTLGFWDIVAGKISLVDPIEALRRAFLDWIQDDKSYDVDTEDALYNDMKDRAGDGVDFVVTGHTHLARAMTTRKNRFYYNCGTWIRLLRVTREALKNRATFEANLWNILMSGRMSDLDTAEIPGQGGNQ